MAFLRSFVLNLEFCPGGMQFLIWIYIIQPCAESFRSIEILGPDDTLEYSFSPARFTSFENYIYHIHTYHLTLNARL